jgi:uncharacterized membrane protein
LSSVSPPRFALAGIKGIAGTNIALASIKDWFLSPSGEDQMENWTTRRFLIVFVITCALANGGVVMAAPWIELSLCLPWAL